MNRETFYFTYKPERRPFCGGVGGGGGSAPVLPPLYHLQPFNGRCDRDVMKRAADYVTLCTSSEYRVRMRYSGPCSLSMYQSHWQP